MFRFKRGKSNQRGAHLYVAVCQLDHFCFFYNLKQVLMYANNGFSKSRFGVDRRQFDKCKEHARIM